MMPLGNLNLAAHDVDAGHHFSDSVLHLNARIDFDEVPLVRFGVYQKLHRAGILITGGAGDPDGGVGQLAAQAILQVDRGRDFDDFLVPPLHRAIPLVEMQQVAVPVAEDLHLDMPRPADVALEKDGVVAERAAGFAPGFFQARRRW